MNPGLYKCEIMEDIKDLTRRSFDEIACLPDNWDHNRYYHNYILRLLPEKGEVALDVGCGTGEFSRLIAERFSKVQAVDLSPRMIEEAQARNSHSRIEYQLCDVEKMQLKEGSYDAIVSIAALHHMDLDVVLPKFKSALRENGVLVVLDLYKQRKPVEFALSVIAAPLNLIARLLTGQLVKSNERKRLWKEHDVIDKRVMGTIETITKSAGRYIPGSRIKRHLFWRYSLVYTKS